MRSKGIPFVNVDHARLPCCDRVPMSIGDHRYVCRGCGLIYREAWAFIADVFGPVHDVTPFVPHRRRLGF